MTFFFHAFSMKILTPLALGLLAALALAGCHTSSDATPQPAPGPIPTAARDTLAYSFAVLGCNRVDNSDLNLATNPSTANVPQLTQTYAELAALKPVPDYLFFMGDMVLGYSPDSAVLGRELRAWGRLYQNNPLSRTGIRLVAMPGNHEVMSGKNQPSFLAAEQAWRSAMRPYTVGSNGPAAGGPDKLATDQSQLTYSFDYKKSHFVVLNTDPVGAEATVPLAWLQADLAAARAKGAKHLFAFGHKPALPAPGGDGLSNGGSMWDVLEANHAEAMLAAHNHLYFRSQQPSYHPWQVIAGNGGSVLDASASPNRLFYGYTLVKVFTSGKVKAYSYGRDLPTNGYLGAITAATPTTVRDSVDLTWK
ncbi:metallophosphoesterase family protein [Hymenobacter sp. BRD67]|uniref:metallophosphoesterase family protein n=1 Tax=Hymenobacter sp. BRD67 TaxID=2675877 RepID=UPI0015633416|nr:metallophosphoesterase [Hymenobacter sp. BRD67]QKG51946.1 metallophosphoesterase [Hymenobacter sp. BRD67]